MLRVTLTFNNSTASPLSPEEYVKQNYLTSAAKDDLVTFSVEQSACPVPPTASFYSAIGFAEGILEGIARDKTLPGAITGAAQAAHDKLKSIPTVATAAAPTPPVEMIPVSWAYELTNRFYGSDYNMSYKTFENALEELRKKVEEAKQASLAKVAP